MRTSKAGKIPTRRRRTGAQAAWQIGRHTPKKEEAVASAFFWVLACGRLRFEAAPRLGDAAKRKLEILGILCDEALASASL